MILHLGVLEMPYVNAPAAKARKNPGKRSKAPPRTARGGTKTTGQVAGYLENNYGLMQAYFSMYSRNISGQIEESMRDALESMMMGAPATLNPMGAATSEIETDFKRALSLREFDGRLQGVPTKAALAGVSHRFKHPRAKRPSRPSFIDTGLYQASFKSWVDG